MLQHPIVLRCHPDPAVAGEGSVTGWLITLCGQNNAYFDCEVSAPAGRDPGARDDDEAVTVSTD